MHGRPRVKDKRVDPDKVRAAEQKAALFGQLLEKVLTACTSKSFDPLHLELSFKLLELNPEVYTVWNYRREALGPIVDAGGEDAVSTIAGELALTEKALIKNPKSYSTWHHRRWAVGSGFCSLERELMLVEKLLDADDRNFHGWGYRQFIARKMGLPVERELAFTQKKIEQNFSNYSAWHYRTAILPAMYSEIAEAAEGTAPEAEVAETEIVSSNKGEEVNEQQGRGLAEHELASVAKSSSSAIERGAPTSASAAVPAEVLDQEFELVKQAFYTEPEDQSGWFYHRWLLGCALARYRKLSNDTSSSSSGSERETAAASSPSAAHDALIHTLATQAAMCKELLEIEPDAKWPLLTYTRLCQLLADLDNDHAAPAAKTSSGGGGEIGDKIVSDDVENFDAIEAYKKLEEMDPLRKGFYKDAAEGLAHVVALPLRNT